MSMLNESVCNGEIKVLNSFIVTFLWNGMKCIGISFNGFYESRNSPGILTKKVNLLQEYVFYASNIYENE